MQSFSITKDFPESWLNLSPYDAELLMHLRLIKGQIMYNIGDLPIDDNKFPYFLFSFTKLLALRKKAEEHGIEIKKDREKGFIKDEYSWY